jgi:hypothetical protein
MYVNYLSATERQTLLALLSEQASDYILLRACESTVDERIQMRIDMTEISKAVKKVPPPTPAATAAKPVVIPSTSNVEPSGEAAARITNGSKEAILAALSTGPLTASAINTAIKGKADNTSRLLKLLWTRKEISFDGVRYNAEGT